MNDVLMNTPLMLICFTVIALAVAGYALKKRAQRPAPWTAKRIVNQSEGRLYVTLERWRRDKARDLNLSTQVSYGSFIAAKKIEDWRKIGSKHADFVFWGRDGYVRAIIEFDGGGHYGNSRDAAEKTRQRDEVKNAAALSANIPLIRIPAESSVSDIIEALESVLLPKQDPVVVSAATDNVSHLKLKGHKR